MNRNSKIFSFVILVLLCLCPGGLFAGQDMFDARCRDSAAYRRKVSALFIDRTTKLSPQATLQLDDGVKFVMQNGYSDGKFLVYEVRDDDFSTQTVFDFCLPGPYVERNNPVQKEEPGFFDRILGPVGSKMIGSDDNGKKIRQANRVEQYNRAIINYKGELAKKVLRFVDDGAACTVKTNLINEFGRILGELLEGRKVVNLYVFTDLEDSELMLHLSDTKWDWADFGRKKAAQLAASYPIPDNDAKISIMFWGVGRSESDVNGKIKPRDYAHLRQFWTSFLTAYIPNASRRLALCLYKDFPKDRVEQMLRAQQ